MRITMRYMTPFLGAAAAVMAISAAPIAGAATTILPNQESCTGAVCQSPGNVQINDAPPAADFYPYGGSAFLLGGVTVTSVDTVAVRRLPRPRRPPLVIRRRAFASTHIVLKEEISWE